MEKGKRKLKTIKIKHDCKRCCSRARYSPFLFLICYRTLLMNLMILFVNCSQTINTLKVLLLKLIIIINYFD